MSETPSLQEAIARAELVIGLIANNAANIAYARRVLYNAYLAEGFNPEQALILCGRLTFD